ncbi:MAG: rRNA maturation RNase YbeY [bacterium]|nr:rRNA maturation RNase YbeY [bacterium]
MKQRLHLYASFFKEKTRMVEVNNLTKDKVDGVFLKKVAKIVLKGENRLKMDLSIALVGQERIKELNRQYRGKNKATDVLSFAYDRNSGEVIICPVKAKKGLEWILIHGILHILGFDHEGTEKEARRMEKKEDYYLLKIS